MIGFAQPAARRWLLPSSIVVALLSGCTGSKEGDPGTSGGPGAAIREGGTERPSKLIFGMTPYLPEDQLKAEFSPLLDYVGNSIGIPMELRVARDYSELSKLVGSYEIHFAVFSPFSYVRAKRDNPGMSLLLTQIADGSSTYSAYIVTHEDSGIKTIDQLKGKRFGFVDRRSTSGYLYPLAYMRNLGHEPEKLFSSVRFAGNHAKVIELVLKGELDAGATFSTAYKMARSRQLHIIAKTGRIPYDAYCASPRLDQALVQQVRNTMLKLSTRSEEGRRVLGRLTNINGFVLVGDEHYDEVRRVARLVESTEQASP